MTTVELAAVPPLTGEVYPEGFDGRRRLYTREHVAFDAMPAAARKTVSIDGWVVSYSQTNSTGMWTLGAFRVTGREPWTTEQHQLDGQRFAFRSDAERAGYDAGLLGIVVYEKDAAALGLPSVDAQHETGM